MAENGGGGSCLRWRGTGGKNTRTSMGDLLLRRPAAPYPAMAIEIRGLGITALPSI